MSTGNPLIPSIAGASNAPLQVYRDPNWGGTASPSITVPNREGATMIALGPNDESGGVVITPLNNLYANTTLRVGVRAPLMVPIVGPFTITSDYALLTGLAHTMECYVFRCATPFLPARAQYRKTGTITVAAGILYFNVRGRDRYRVMVETTGANATVTVGALMVDAAGNGPSQTQATAALVNPYNWCFQGNSVNVPNATTDQERQLVCPDFITLQTATNSLGYMITAED